MSYADAKQRYALLGMDTDAALEKLKTIPVSLHCWQGDDVRGFDTDPSKPLTGGIQTTGNYPGRAQNAAGADGRSGGNAQALSGHKEAKPACQLCHFWRPGSGWIGTGWNPGTLPLGWSFAKSMAWARI